MRPGKIVCFGRNYAEHAKELGNEIPPFPLVFLKPSSSLINSGNEIIHPDFGEELHHEVELVLLIGKDIKNVSLEEAEDAIIGYAVGLDMTLRDVQDKLKSKGAPWTLAKCFDTSAVVSEFRMKKDYKLSLNETIELKVNGNIRQSAKLSLMLHKPAHLVQGIAEKMKIEKGDLLFTGTPAGVGRVKRGDILEASIENIGEITVKVV